MAKAKAKKPSKSLILEHGGGAILHLDPVKDLDKLKDCVTARDWKLSDPDGLLDNDPNKDWFFGKISKFWSPEEIKAGDHKPKKRKRARNKKGQLVGDDPSTPDVNEAYVNE